jgi:predicted nucleic acid-binding Zn ribbon protein
MKKIGDVIEKLVKQNRWEEQFFQGRLERAWPLLMGEKIAGNVKIESLKGKVLTLSAESSVWRTEMMLRRSQIISMVNSYYAREVVTNIKFR